MSTCPCIVRFRFHVRFCIPVNLNIALWIFMTDMAIILLISEAPTRLRRSLKGLFHEKGWVKSAENLGASPFNRALSNYTTFSQTNLAG